MAAQYDQLTVPMDLFETKGGKPRTVWVPLAYASRVRDWIDGRRITYARKYFLKFGSRTERLFLGDHPAAHGNPLSAQTIYRVFAEVGPRPDGWSPHKGRHTFACFYVLNALALEAGKDGIAAKGADWVNDRGKIWLKFLQKQFGHVDERTTDRYLRWLIHASALAHLSMGWHRFLEGTDE
jgi:integrase